MAAILATFFDDRSRWFLWWPVGMGIGIAIYFSLSQEPSAIQALIPFLISFGAACLVRYFWHQCVFLLLIVMTLLSLTSGFAAAKFRTISLNTPFLLAKIENIKITGRIINIEEQPHRRRLTLDQVTFLKQGLVLHKIRLTMPLLKPLPATIGDFVTCHASLLPFSEPASLKGYDFRRQAYFRGIGATGFIKSAIQVDKLHDKRLWLATIRYNLTRTIRQYLPDQTGEIAAALITGDYSGISPCVRQRFIDAGLSHILAISGLHLTLVAGIIFLIFRRGLALIPYLAENYPIKKWAAVLVIISTFLYLVISGFGIPGQRAFVMITIVMLGILLDRDPLSMRLVAIAATIILLIRPESLLSASFQLSFAAVIGLIAVYESGWNFLKQWSLEGGYLRRFMAYGIGIIVTTFVATLATIPFSVVIFNRFTLQTIAGNFLAIPLTSILIMPAATLSVISLTFGGYKPIFQLLSFGIQKLNSIAQIVSSWPGAAIMVPTPPPAFLGLITLGGLWICLWKNSWRWAGLIFCGLGCLSCLFEHPADIYVASNGLMAYRKEDILYISDLKRCHFFADLWMKELGLQQQKEWPQDQVRIGPVILIRQKDLFLKLSKDTCRQKILVTTTYAWQQCRRWRERSGILIDRSTLNRNGAYQMWVTSKGIKVKYIRKSLGSRPWSQVHIRKSKNNSAT